MDRKEHKEGTEAKGEVAKKYRQVDRKEHSGSWQRQLLRPESEEQKKEIKVGNHIKVGNLDGRVSHCRDVTVVESILLGDR